jgi:hypothetical protein
VKRLIPAVQQQLDRGRFLEEGNPALAHLFGKPADDLDAGQIAPVHCAIEGLTGEGLLVDGAVGVAVEKTAELRFQLDHIAFW